MYGGSGDSSDSKKILIILVVALIVVVGGTILLNGNTSSEIEEVNNTTEEVVPEVNTTTSTIIGNNSMGSVSKIATYGNDSSSVRIALIVGVNQKDISNNSIIPTLENQNDLKYAYDVYMINVTNDVNEEGIDNSQSNMSVNDKTQLLAKEFAVSDIINNNYNCSVDIHSTEDSNSYIFVPSDDTVTSKYLVKYISNTTSVGRYSPESASYAKQVSLPIISSNIPSFVYVTREFNTALSSSEINEVIHAIDNFDFGNISIYSDSISDNNSNSNNSNGNNSNITNPRLTSGTSVNKEVD